MTEPSENAFLATLGASTVVTFVGLYLANRTVLWDTSGPPRVKLGPSVSARSVGLTLVALLGGCAVVFVVAMGLHRLIGDAMLWWIALALVPVSLGPTLYVAMWAVAADARGDLRVDGDALVARWDGEERRWHLPDCTVTLRLTPSRVPGSDAALLMLVDGPTGFLPVTMPLVGIPGVRWMVELGLPDGWFDPPGGVAFPVSDGPASSRVLVDAVVARAGAVDRG